MPCHTEDGVSAVIVAFKLLTNAAVPALSAHIRMLPATATFKLSMSPDMGIEMVRQASRISCETP